MITDEVKKLLIDSKEKATKKRQEREEQDQIKLQAILHISNKYYSEFNKYIFELIEKGLIIAKKDVDLNDLSNDNEVSIEFYNNTFCQAKVSSKRGIKGWVSYAEERFYRDPVISIHLNAFDVKNMNFFYEANENFTDIQKEYLTSIRENMNIKDANINTNLLRILVKYNNEHSDTNILLIPYCWQSDKVVSIMLWGYFSNLDYWYYCVLQLNEYRKLGFDIKINNNNTIDISISVSEIEKLVKYINKLKSSDTVKLNTFKLSILEYSNKLGSILSIFNNRKYNEKELRKKCLENYKLISLYVYEQLLKLYKQEKDIYDDNKLEVDLTFDNSIQQAENHDLYEKYIFTNPTNMEDNVFKFVKYKDGDDKKINTRYIPVLVSDLKKLAKELGGYLSLSDNSVTISVNSVVFENMLINFQCENTDIDNEEKGISK